MYLRVDASGISTGGGLYEPSRDQLARARRAIAQAPGAAAALHAALDPLEAAGYEVAGPSLRTAPRGRPIDHPEIALLRLRHCAALRSLPITASLGDVHAVWRATRPLIDWSRDHVGPAESWR